MSDQKGWKLQRREAGRSIDEQGTEGRAWYWSIACPCGETLLVSTTFERFGGKVPVRCPSCHEFYPMVFEGGGKP